MTIAVGLGSEYSWYAPTLSSPAGDSGSFGADLTDNNFTSVNGTEQAPTGGGGTSVAWFSNGTDSRGLTLGNAFSDNYYNNTTGKTSLSFWMLPEATNSVVAVGSGLYGTPPLEVRLNCGRDSNGDMYASFESGGSVLLNANLGSGTTNMIHVAMVWDDNVRAAIYKNGVLVAEDTTVGTWTTGPAGGALMMATSSTGLNTGGGGYIDDFRIYRSILSETQITHLATERKVLGAVGLGGEKLWLSPSVGHSNSIAMDMSGTSNNGTYRNGVGTIADTSSGGTLAFDFDGTADRIDFPSTILGGSQVFSMACWVYVDSHDQNDGQGYMGQVELGNPAGSNDVAALYSGGWNTSPDFVSTSWRSVTFAGGSYGYTSVPNSYSPPTGSWHHIACVADGSVNTLYVDGVAQLYPSSYTGSFPTPSSSFQIGRYGSSNNGCLDGRMDDARVYHRALTQSEITHLASQRGVEGPPPVGLGDEQLWWCPTHSQNNYADISDSSHSMTTLGSAVALVADTDAGGQYAGQFAANGSVRVQDQFKFMTTGDVSVSGWIKASAAAYVVICAQQTGGVASNKSGVAVDQYLSENRAKFFDGINNDELLLLGGNTPPNNTWYHVATTKAGTTCKLFVNGVLLTSGTQLGIPSTPDYKDLLIGGAWNGANPLSSSTGYMDDIRVFDRALTQAEITHLAEARGIEGPPPVGLGDEKLWLCPSINDSAADISGNGNDGTYNGGMGTIADLSNGGSRCYDFDGGSDFIELPAGVVSASDPITISLWVEQASTGGSRAYVSDWDYAANKRSVLFGSSAGDHLAYFSNTGTPTTQQITGSAVTTVWAHVLVSQSAAGDIEFYKDGVLDDTGGPYVGRFNSGSAWLVGAIGTPSSLLWLFSGKMDDIRAYNRVLTQAEITHLASQRGVEGPPPVGLGDEVAWICPTLNSGGVADISGSGHDGTLEASASIVSDVAEGGTQAISLTGSVGGCLTLDSSILPVIQDGRSVTYSCWYKNLSAGNEMIGFSTKGGGSNGWYVGKESTAGGNISLLKARAGSVTAESANLGSDITGWSHLAWTIDGSGVVTGYQNGVAASMGAIGTAGTSGLIAYIGSNSSTFASAHYQDDCRLYDRTLTQAEITHLAEARGIEGPPPVGLGDEQLWLCPSINDSANDISGSGNDGTYNGGMGTVADTGEGGSRAFEFDGVDDYVSLVGPAIDRTSSPFSTSVWVKQDNAAVSDPNAPYVTRYSFGYSKRAYGSFPDKGYESFFLYSGSLFYIDLRLTNWDNSVGLWNRYTLSTSPNNTWLNVCVTYDGSLAASGLKLFANGIELTATVVKDLLSDTDLATAGDAVVGGYAAAVANVGLDFSFGRQDDIRFYDRVLTQAEITHLAEARGIEGPPPVGLGDEQLWLCPSLNDSAADISGNGNDGTYNGGMGTIADTSNGGSRCYDFDGTDDYIDTGSTTVHQNTVFTYAFWLNASESNSGTEGTAGSYETSGGHRGPLAASISGDNKLTWLYQSLGSSYNSTQLLKSSGDVYDSTWRHVTCEFDGDNNEVKIYIDGSLDSSKTASVPNIVNISTALKFGAGSGGFTDGMMDDIRVYNRTLTQAEITHLAEARGIEGPPPVGLGDEQLWLCPSLNDSANDISGNGNDGTYNGGMATVLSDSKLAYDFDGTDDYIDIQGLTGQYPIGGSYSTSIWVYQDTVKQQSYFNRYQSAVYPYDFGTTGQRTEWLYAGTTNTLTIAGFNSAAMVGLFPMSFTLATQLGLRANGTNQSGAWYNLVTTYDSTTKTQTLYKNGVNVGSTVYSATNNEVLLTDYAEVGRVSVVGTSENYFAGKMDDVRSFTRVLTQSEITHLAEARGIEGPPPVGLGDEQLWLCPSINDSANDISGNGNDGTYNNGIATVADTDATYGGSRAYFSNAQSQSVSVANFGESLTETTTISLWAKSINPYVCVPIVSGAFGYSASAWAYALFNSSTTRIFYNKSTSTNFPATPTSNQWQHICIVRETGSSTQEIYFDGTLVATSASNLSTYNNTFWSGFGNAIGVAEELFVDDIRTYGRVLTQAEITHLATSRGIEGGPSAPDVFFNPFKSTTFQNQTFNNGGIGE